MHIRALFFLQYVTTDDMSEVTADEFDVRIRFLDKLGQRTDLCGLVPEKDVYVTTINPKEAKVVLYMTRKPQNRRSGWGLWLVLTGLLLGFRV